MTESRKILLLIAASGGGIVIGVLGTVLYFRIRRHSWDFTQLGQQLSELMNEIQNLEASLNEIQSLALRGTEKSLPDTAPFILTDNTFNRQLSVPVSPLSPTNSDAYFDTVETLADDQSKVSESIESLKIQGNDSVSLVELVNRIDVLLSSQTNVDVESLYYFMKQNYSRGSNDAGFLWRFSMACYLYGQIFINERNDTRRHQLLVEAKRYAFEALSLNDNDPNVHKWCALTLGVLCDFVGVKEKIQDGHQFKIHIDRALELAQNDSVLHHLKGRWCFGVASLSWFERKVATTIFAEPPQATFHDALTCFLEADRLKPGWLENILYIIKTYVACKNNDEARNWILKSRDIDLKSSDDLVAKQQISNMLHDI